MRRRLIALLLAGVQGLALSSIAHARDAATVPLDHLPALSGDYFAIRSQATGREYHIYVRLPEGYAQHPDRRWPVVYLLDGDSLFPLLAPTHLFLHYDEQLPEAILVGIAYGSFDPAVNARHIDFSDAAPDTPPGEAGAAAFLAFLRDELLPEAERRHRVDPRRRVLVGQSRGGYFVLWSALREPDLFWGRIASNPVLSRGRDALFVPPVTATTETRLVVTSGARDLDYRVRNAHDWHGFWSRRDRPWELDLMVLPEGTHAASIGEAYRRAMLHLFREDIAKARAADGEG